MNTKRKVAMSSTQKDTISTDKSFRRDKPISMELHNSLKERINAAIDMFDEDRYTDCATEMKDMMKDDDLPGFYRIKCGTILATTYDDWYVY